MRPILFSIGSTGISAFFFMIMIASLSATWLAIRLAKREGLSEIIILDLAIIAIIASMIGARVFHVAIEAPDYYWEKPIRVFYFWQGGFVSLGAFTFTAFSWLIYLRKRGANIAQYLDLTANVAPVIIFFVRLGCLLTGCCYGKPAAHWPHVIFTNPSSTAYLMKHGNIPLHPTQIYFMLNAVVMLVVLMLARKYRKFYGHVGAIFLMYEGVSRFFIEFLRGDEDRGIYFNGLVSTGQIVMVLFFTAGLLMWLWLRKNRISV
ncbi:MAG: prolipoprotein diacylglyceryl transferase [Deltaproteobacteria bacterium]|nr:prolipoprotein diacylglyceryl transferase [Deltaproteobacteria bacterium]MBI2974152.1 prolipoprotein diacylglyceryl transferase [Deltaproteobacteria bacterium]